MKFVPLVWAMLWRSRVRTALTMLSIAIAFLLFGLLQSVLVLFDANVRLANAQNLYVTAKNGIGQPMPLSYRAQIAAIPGVAGITPIGPMRAWYQDPKNQLQCVAADPADLAADPRLRVAPEQVEAARRTRNSAVVGRDLARKYGWKIGDRVPILTDVPKTDGSSTWEVVIAGFYDFDKQLMGDLPTVNMFVNFDYYEEARLFDKGQVFLYVLRIADPRQADAISAAIDKLFENSAAETRTQTESVFNLNQANEFADIGLIVHGILTAVFFTLVLVAGNTMVRAFRERVPELAVLKTIGFGDRTVAVLVVAEALLLTLAAAAAGLGLAAAIVPPTFKAVLQLPGIHVEWATLAGGVAVALGLGLVAALIPAWQARRLTIVAALAGE